MLNRQGGMTLLEVLAAIAVGTVLFIGLTDMIDVSLEDARGQQAAYHQAQVTGAANNYIAGNYATLKTDTDSGGVVAVTVPNLKTGGFLPGHFADQNSYQQNTCMLVRQDSNGKLNALVVTYGGRAIPDRSIVAVAMNAGPGAGYIPSTDTVVARGPSWSLNTTPYHSGTCAGNVKPLSGGTSDAGHLVSSIFYDGPGQLSTEFLYRDEVPNRPDLNRMNVPLQMANAGLVDLGDSCTQTALALERTTKDVVVCDGAGGNWRYSSSSWKNPVASYGELANVSKKDGDVRVTLNTNRAFVYRASTNTWNALAVDQNGDLNVPENIVAGRDIVAGQDIVAARDIEAIRDMVANRDLIVSRNIDANGDVDIAQNLDVGETLIARGNIDAKKNMDIDGYFRGAGEVRGQWMATNMIVIDGPNVAGGACHKVKSTGPGSFTVENPHGTLMIDWKTGYLINCVKTDSRFHFTDEHP